MVQGLKAVGKKRYDENSDHLLCSPILSKIHAWKTGEIVLKAKKGGHRQKSRIPAGL